MTSPVSVRTEVRPRTEVSASPLNIILVTPKVELGANAGADVTIPAADSTLTEITSANETDQLGAGTFAKDAYDFIESGASSRLWVLPFPVVRADAEAARLSKVVTALSALDKTEEKAKLPNGKADMIVCPRETGLGTGANPVVAKLKTFGLDTHIGAVSIVDAGEWGGANPVAQEPSQADVLSWETANADPNVMAVTNRADVSGYDGMWGSVIAAAHWARWTSLRGIHYQPTNLVDTLAGVSDITPERVFNESDGSSSAVTLGQRELTSLITWNGQHFLWGGKTRFTGEDPRSFLSNNIVAHRIVKDATQDMAIYVGRRGNRANLAGLQVKLQDDLSGTYAPSAVRDIQVAEVTLVGGKATARVFVQFYDFIESVELIAEIFV